MSMYVEVNGIDTLRALADAIKKEYGKEVSIEALTLVIKVDGWQVKAFNLESGCIYSID